MATIVNNTPGSDNGSGAAGWVVAGVVIVALVLVALFVWPGYGRNAAAPATPATGGTVNVTLPAAGGEGSSGGGAAQ